MVGAVRINADARFQSKTWRE